jgi:hypothetical protein
MGVEPVLPDVERHHGIAVGGDHVGPGRDIALVDLRHEVRRLDQRQRRPFGLAERRAAARQFAAGAAIEDDHAAHRLTVRRA